MQKLVGKVLVFVLIFCLLTTEAFSDSKKQSAELIPRKVIFGNAEKSSPRLSPDGTKLAFLAPDKNGVMNVWIQDLLKPSKEAELVTSDKKRGIRSFMWRYDGKHILYGQDSDGDENVHIFQTNIKNKKTVDLTPFKDVKAGMLAYEREFPDEMLIVLNKRDCALFDVYRLNLNDGKLHLEAENTEGTLDWMCDHTLQVRGQQFYDKDGSTVVAFRDGKNSPWRQVLRVSPQDEVNLLDFTADNNSVLVITSKDAKTNRLLKINLKDGSEELLFSDPQYDVTAIIENPDTYQIEAIGVDKERFEWTFVDSSHKEDYERLQKKDANMEVVSRDFNDKQWLVAYEYDNRPVHYYHYDVEKKKSRFLFTSRPELEGYKLAKMTPISFEATDGMTIYGYLTLPVGKEKNLPTVLYVHGGPWVRDHWGLHPLVQWLANRGYAVLQVNYRGSSGYGKEYLNAGNKEWGGKMHTDLIDGKKWMIDKGYTDPKRVAIFGGSYGGYATLVGLAFTPDEFSCGVNIVGVSNIVTHLQTIPPYWEPFKPLTDIRIGNLETEREFLESRSPIFKAHKIKVPLLIAHGAHDPRVKQSESEQIVATMRKNGKEVEYLLFPDEGHGFQRPENKLKFFACAEAFLSKHLGGAKEAPHADEDWHHLRK